MTTISVSLVDVYPIRRTAAGLEFLALRRGRAGRCPGSWEAVHGHIEPGESPVDAARRELQEETGLPAARLYNLSRVESFYQHGPDELALVPVFAAFVAPEAGVRTGPEHDLCEWLPPAAARSRFTWPRERRAVDDITILLGGGDAGPVEDVLRVC
ncbi:MAG TPA: NUDIX domain-containing protein [Gemmatimonadales bacterium]|nr:NUDIX domain-containing protein [Gemmatimonadales bacterium]